MGVILERADQVVSVTDVSRSAKTIFERLTNGKQDKYVVMKNNAPVAVMMPVKAYESLMDELEDLRMEIITKERAETFNQAEALGHQEMMDRFGNRST